VTGKTLEKFTLPEEDIALGLSRHLFILLLSSLQIMLDFFSEASAVSSIAGTYSQARDLTLKLGAP